MLRQQIVWKRWGPRAARFGTLFWDSAGVLPQICALRCELAWNEVMQSCFVFQVMLVSWQGHCRLLSISVIWSAVAERRMCWRICLSTESEHLVWRVYHRVSSMYSITPSQVVLLPPKVSVLLQGWLSAYEAYVTSQRVQCPRQIYKQGRTQAGLDLMQTFLCLTFGCQFVSKLWMSTRLNNTKRVWYMCITDFMASKGLDCHIMRVHWCAYFLLEYVSSDCLQFELCYRL